MPRNRVRVRVVATGEIDALQGELDAALEAEQADHSWHVSEVQLTPHVADVAAPDGFAPGPYVALITSRKREWFLGDMLGTIAGMFRGRAANSEPPAPPS
ncbi:MAG: hypothetical protein QM692_04375 [Thermomicrobiales bacterium]